jgi:3',5'-cyclic AMP phosphodiesterase CpdA
MKEPDIPIKTFVHISDLHFGDLGAEGEVIYDRGMKTLWTLLPLFTGLAGHEHKALVHLHDFYKKTQAKEKMAGRDVTLLLTGDLTSTGKDGQFHSAVNFVERELPPPVNPGLGLGTGAWLDASMRGNRRDCSHQAIPGNHDHWPGRYLFLGPPRSRMCEWAEHLPFIRPYRE